PQARAALLPHLDLQGSVERLQDVYDGSPEFIRTQQTYSLQLVQPLYLREARKALARADALVAQAEARYQAARQGLILRLAEAYLGVLRARAQLAFVEADRKATQRQLEQARQRFKVGMVAVTDVEEAKAARDRVEAERVLAENALASAREALQELTGRPPGTLEELGPALPLVRPDPADVERWVRSALEQNFEVLAQAQALRAAREEVERRRSGHYPTLSLVANDTYIDRKFNFGSGRVFPLRGQNRSLALQLQLPLYSGGAVSAGVREALHRQRQAEEELERVRRQVTRQTRDAYRGVEASLRRVKALEQALRSARTALEATQAGFEVGTRTTVDVLQAQRNLFRARRDLADARYDYVINLLRLQQAAGSLDEAGLRRVAGWFVPPSQGGEKK
ncbi:MAG: type I secretion protein TolC, partial [Gammaproteobacteria bacterium]